jgi:hypothetical protein
MVKTSLDWCMSRMDTHRARASTTPGEQELSPAEALRCLQQHLKALQASVTPGVHASMDDRWLCRVRSATGSLDCPESTARAAVMPALRMRAVSPHSEIGSLSLLHWWSFQRPVTSVPRLCPCLLACLAPSERAMTAVCIEEKSLA